MQIVIKESYAGEMVHLQVVGKNEGTVAVQLTGYIETGTVRMQYLTSSFRTIHGQTLSVRLPNVLLPTFANGHFRVWYECIAMFSGSSVVRHVPFVVVNNNLRDFQDSGIITLRMSSSEDDEYRRTKKRLADLVLSLFLAGVRDFSPSSGSEQAGRVAGGETLNGSIDSEDDDPGDASEGSGSSACKSTGAEDDRKRSRISRLQKRCKAPCFECPLVLELPEKNKEAWVGSSSARIAKIRYPAVFKTVSTITIEYLQNIKMTEIVVYKYQYEQKKLQDLCIIFNSTFKSNECLEKPFVIELDGCTLKNFLFEIRYALNIIFDDVEIFITLPVAADNVRTAYLDE